MSVFQDFKRETKVFGNRTVIVQVQRFSFSRKVIKQPVFLCLLYPLFHEPVQIFHKLILLNPSPISGPPSDIEESESLSAPDFTLTSAPNGPPIAPISVVVNSPAATPGGPPIVPTAHFSVPITFTPTRRGSEHSPTAN